MKKLILLVALLVCLISLVVSAAYTRNLSIFNALDAKSEVSAHLPWGQIALQGFFLIGGITFGHLHRRFNELKRQGQEQVNLRAEVTAMVNAVDFLIALTAAPIVYGAVLAASQDAPVLASVILAFQNGFFWKTIFASKEKSLEQPMQPLTPSSTVKPDGSV